jgi:hypothetical protein
VIDSHAVDEEATRGRRLEIRAERLGREVDPGDARREVPRTERPLGEYLQATADGVQCTWCGAEFGDGGVDWKERVVLRRIPVADAGPLRADDEFTLIQACCPECGTLLDADLALGDDPPLHDRVDEWREA